MSEVGWWMGGGVSGLPTTSAIRPVVFFWSVSIFFFFLPFFSGKPRRIHLREHATTRGSGFVLLWFDRAQPFNPVESRAKSSREFARTGTVVPSRRDTGRNSACPSHESIRPVCMCPLRPQCTPTSTKRLSGTARCSDSGFISPCRLAERRRPRPLLRSFLVLH